MINAVMYGMIPREEGDPGPATAGEEVEEAEDVRPGVVLRDLLHGLDVDARHRDERAEPVEREHDRREQQLLPDVGDPEGVEDGGEIIPRAGLAGSMTWQVPPAPSIRSRAVFENCGRAP